MSSKVEVECSQGEQSPKPDVYDECVDRTAQQAAS